MKPPRALGDLVGAGIDPLLRQRTGLKADLIAHWAQMIGDDLAPHCQPVQIRWPRPISHDLAEDAQQEPGTLVVSATGIWALRVQHSTGEMLAGINRYFGYQAIGRIAIEQRVVATAARAKSAPAAQPGADPAADRHIDMLVDDIDDEALRETMRKLGRVIHAENRKKPRS